MLFNYRYCNQSLASTEKIDELHEVPSTAPVELSFSCQLGPQREVAAWDYQSVHGCRPTLSIARLDHQHLLRFYDNTEFCVDPEAGTVACNQPASGAVRHHLLDQVLPRLLNARGLLMVHGSAVLTPRGAIVFVGESGRGKSTLAAAFHRSGHTLLTDDCMHLSLEPTGGVSCTPTYPSLRLWPDSADALADGASSVAMSDEGSKRRIHISEPERSASTAPVVALCLLGAEEAGSVELTRIAPMNIAAGLISQCFRLDLGDAPANAAILDQSLAVIDRIPAVELRYPRNHSQLPLVQDDVLRWLAEVTSDRLDQPLAQQRVD